MVTNTVEDILTNTIFGGLVSGVATGLVLALIFWIYNEQKRRSERKEQIRHLSSIISTHKKRMYKPTIPFDLPTEITSDPNLLRMVTEITTDTNLLRKGIFDSMKHHIITALDGRCSRLNFDEIHQLRTLLEGMGRMINAVPPTSEPPWTDEFCGMLFDGIESIKWLDIPEGPNFFSSQHERSNAN